MAGVPNSSSAEEFSGKSVEEATADGLRRMGLRAEEATVEIVARGSRGLFGLGSEPAVVRISRVGAATPSIAEETAQASEVEPLIAPAAEAERVQTAVEPAPARAESAPTPVAPVEHPPASAAPERDEQVGVLASEMLTTLIELMGFDARVEAAWRDADDITDERHLLLSVHGDDLSPLIGRRGDTLDSLQYLLRLMVNQKQHRWLNIIVDVEQYRAKRVEHLTHLAQRMAEQVATTGRSFALEPMPPNERRIIHLALRDHPQIYTESAGDGERRKVIIYPRK